MPDADLSDRPLSVPLLVRGSFDNGLFVCCCVVSAVSACVGGLILRDGDLGAAAFVFGLSAAAGAPALVLGLWLRRQREWLEVTSAGFVLSRGDVRRIFADAAVAAVVQQSSPAGDGNLKRRLVLEIAGDDPERIDCRYRTPAWQPDPLAAFVARLVRGVADRAESDVGRGAKWRGEGWTLDADCLRRGRETLLVERITAVGFYDAHLCVWEGDDERPRMRFSDGSRNAHALGEVLARRVRRRPDHDRPPPGLPLGRLLLERRSWGFWLGVGLATAGASAALGLVLLATGDDVRVKPPWLGFAAACGCLAVGGVLVASHGRFGRLRFFERGLSLTNRLGGRQLAYDEIGEIIWKKGLSLVVKPLPGLGLRAIRFRTVGGYLGVEVAAMRDRACAPIAERWLVRVAQAPVDWTPRLRLLPGGLEYRPTGLLGVGDWVTMPYECANFRIENEQFVLFANDETWPACKERVDLPNFFVGLAVLDRLSRQRREARLLGASDRLPRAAPVEGDDRMTRGQGDGVQS